MVKKKKEEKTREVPTPNKGPVITRVTRDPATNLPTGETTQELARKPGQAFARPTTERRQEVEEQKAISENKGTSARLTQEQKQKLAGETQIIEEEKQRIIDEETPERRELDPAQSFTEKTPVLGGTIGTIKDRIQEIVLATVPEGEYKEAFKNSLGVATPEELRSLSLTQIEKEEIERGLSMSEKFGALVEGIPVFGSLASKWAGGLIETPSENAREVKSNVLKEKRRITNIETNVKLGYLPGSVAREQISDIEENVQRLESRLKLLISNSPELKFNSDLVNTYETELLATTEKIFQAKQNILTGATQDPDEIQILQRLQLQEDAEDL